MRGEEEELGRLTVERKRTSSSVTRVGELKLREDKSREEEWRVSKEERD